MTEAAFQAQLVHFVDLYEKREKIKDDAKAINAQFKEMNDNVHQFLLNQPPGTSMKIKNYGIQLKSKTKTSGMNSVVIGEAYIEFQTKISQRTVTEAERDAYLETIKQARARKKEVIQEVSFIKVS
jgi:uncharacterized coiled-coil DUF342 family protein